MRNLAITLFIFLTVYSLGQTNSRGAEAENTTTTTGKTHCVIIGVSSYAQLPEAQQLDFADDDALFFKEYLKSQGVINPRIFLNEQAAGKDKIGTEIRQVLINEAQEGDHVIIYFAGHGDVDSLGGDGFLLLNNVDLPSVSAYDFSDALSLGTISKIINYAVERRKLKVTFIADACHSGSMRSGNANKMISEINNNILTITSCQHDELSKESIEFGNGHGVFTYFLVQGLMGMADQEYMGDQNGSIDLSELEMYVKAKVSMNTQKKQNPVFSMSGNKEFASVDKRLLEVAQKNKNLSFKELAAFTKDKVVSTPEEGFAGPCGAYLQLFKEQTIDGKFFKDELDSLDKLPIASGFSKTKKSHSKKINAIAISPDGMYTATASVDGIAINIGKDVERPVWLKGQTGEIVALDFSPIKGLLASASNDGTVLIWNVSKGQILNSLTNLPAQPTCVLFLSENKLIIGTTKGSIVLCDLAAGTRKEIKLHKGSVTDAERIENTLITSGVDGKLIRSDLTTYKKIGQLGATIESTIHSIQLIPSSGRLITGSEDGILRIWDSSSGTLVKEIKTEVGAINGFSIEPFERYVFFSGSRQKKVGILDLESQTVLKSKLLTTGSACGVIYDPVFHVLKVAEADGSVSAQDVKINPEKSAATDLYDKLSECEDLRSIKYKIDGTLIIGLNNAVNVTLDDLVNGKSDVSLSEVRDALRYARKAFDIGREYEFDAEKLEINVLLLQIYEILLSKDVTKNKEALEKLKRLEELDPKGAYVYNVGSMLYVQLQDLTKAREIAMKAEQLAPNWSEASVNTGKVLLLVGDRKAAETRFKEAIKETPEMTKGYVALGELYLIQGRFSEAVEQFSEARKLDPGSEKITKLYGEAYVKAGASNQGSSGKKGGKSAQDKYANLWPLIQNNTFYSGYSNPLRIKDPSIIPDLKFTTSSGVIENQGGKLYIKPGIKKNAEITVVDIFTGDTVGVHNFSVKPMPKPVFMWGKSKDGGFIDFSSTDFFYGYPNEPDLQETGIMILGYEAIFVEEGTTVGDEFNPNGAVGGALAISGDGARVNPSIYYEVKRRQSLGLIGKVCIQLAIKYPSGVKEVKSGCFNY